MLRNDDEERNHKWTTSISLVERNQALKSYRQGRWRACANAIPESPEFGNKKARHWGAGLRSLPGFQLTVAFYPDAGPAAAGSRADEEGSVAAVEVVPVAPVVPAAEAAAGAAVAMYGTCWPRFAPSVRVVAPAEPVEAGDVAVEAHPAGLIAAAPVAARAAGPAAPDVSQ